MKNFLKFSFTWGRKFLRSLHREAALDSLRNVMAVVGLGTVIGDFATMRLWMVLPCLSLAFLVWFADYQRHFQGESVEESLVRQLAEGREAINMNYDEGIEVRQ